MSTEPPDTTEAVAQAVWKGNDEWLYPDGSGFCGQTHREGFITGKLAEIAITAHRQALADAGWVEAPKVKVKLQTGDDADRRVRAMGWNSALIHLQSLGLPIELDES